MNYRYLAMKLAGMSRRESTPKDVKKTLMSAAEAIRELDVERNYAVRRLRALAKATASCDGCIREDAKDQQHCVMCDAARNNLWEWRHTGKG